MPNIENSNITAGLFLTALISTSRYSTVIEGGYLPDRYLCADRCIQVLILRLKQVPDDEKINHRLVLRNHCVCSENAAAQI